jgi:ATP:ADP antiporter, AAA family
VLVARAAARHPDPRLIPELVARLPRRAGREAVRQALAAIGKPAADALSAALADRGRPRDLRKHLPRALARFGNQQAADLLARIVEEDADGLVRFNALRGLGRLVIEHDVRVDRRRMERLARMNLLEHLRLDGLRAAIGDPTDAVAGCNASVGQLLTGLLDDKRGQALERVFRLLKIAHRREDLERVHFAVSSSDPRARANAAEFLDTLLGRPDQKPLRELLQIAVDEQDRNGRLARVADPATRTRRGALVALMADADATLASLATYYAGSLGDEELDRAAKRTFQERPTLEQRTLQFLQIPPAPAAGVAHA